jgi:Flp pilus assembly protein TadG
MHRVKQPPTLSLAPSSARRARGQAMVEFAIVVLLLLGMMVGILEGARLAAAYFVVGNAAREGARAGVFASASDTTIQTKINDTAWRVIGQLPSGDNAITICRRAAPDQACGSTPLGVGSVIDVTVAHTFRFLPFAGGWLGQQSVALTSFHRAYLE